MMSMFSWRITKYNPNYRDEFGRYKKSEWKEVNYW